MNLITIKNVSKIYQSGSHFKKGFTRAVHNVSLEIHENECLAIVGESGSGKSTLGRMLVGLEEPTSGEISFRGQHLDVRHMDKKVRRAIQMVYQNSYEATNPRFTAEMVVEEPLRYFKLVPKADRKKVVTEYLKKVGIPANELHKKTGGFSGGQLQRICIARAMASNPEIILLDEPLSSLDVSVQATIINLLKELKHTYGLTYVLISHDLKTVYNLADRLSVMYFGQIVEEIDDMNQFETLSHPYTELLLGKDCRGSKVAASGESALKNHGCPFAERCPHAQKICIEKNPELRSIQSGHRMACHIGAGEKR